MGHTPPPAPLQGDSQRAQDPQHPHTGVLQRMSPSSHPVPTARPGPIAPPSPGGGAGAPLAQGAAGAAARGRGAAAAAAFAQPLAQQFLSRSHKTCLTCPAPLRQEAATQRLRREWGWLGPAAPKAPPPSPRLGFSPTSGAAPMGRGARSCIPMPPRAPLARQTKQDAAGPVLGPAAPRNHPWVPRWRRVAPPEPGGEGSTGLAV